MHREGYDHQNNSYDNNNICDHNNNSYNNNNWL